MALETENYRTESYTLTQQIVDTEGGSKPLLTEAELEKHTV